MPLLTIGPNLESGAGPGPEIVQTFRVALRAKLLSIDDLTDIVDSHIYPSTLPPTHDLDRDGPAVTYEAAKFPRGLLGHVGHVLSGSDGTVLARVELTVWGYTFSVVDAAALVLFHELDGIRNASDWGNGSIRIVTCLYSNELDDPEPAAGGRQQLIYRLTSEFWIKYRPNPLPIHS